MDPFEWIVVHNAPRPTIFATIQTDHWSITAETTDVNIGISVLEHSLLILTCVAGYPVFWYNNDTTEQPQTRTHNPFLPLNSTFGFDIKNYSYFARGPSEIPPIARYEANLTIENLTYSTEDRRYYCLYENSVRSDDRFITEIGVFTKTEPDTSVHGEVIQAGFEGPRQQISHLFRYWNTKLSIPFIYGIPPNGTVTYALFTIDPDQEWVLPEPQFGNTSKTLKILDFLEVEQKLLSPRLCQAIVTITRGSYFHRGDFYFIIRTNTSDGTFVEKREKFHICLDTVWYEVDDTEQLNPFDASTILTYHQLYEARLYFSNPDWINPRLAVFEQVHMAEGCGQRIIPPAQFYEICGIVAFSQFDEEIPSITQKGLRVTIYAKNPCILTVTFDSNKTADTVSASLYMATLDTDIFGKDRSGTRLMADPPLLNNNTAFTNESITFRCLLPKCHLFYISWHVRDGYSWPPCTYNSCPDGSVPYANITFLEVNNLTVSINAHLSQLLLGHSGLYSCALVARSPRQQFMEAAVAAKLDIQVKDPIPPIFSDGLNFETFNLSFKEGTSLPLLCKVDGLPKPEVAWIWKLEDNGSLHHHLNNRSDNSTFEVYQPGTYICTATNKYGWNSRTYNIQYDNPDDKSHMYLPLAIAIPVAVVLFALVSLLVWWLRRRALQASFRELAKTLQESTENIPLDESTFLNDQVQFVQYNRNLEIDRSLFTVTTKLLGTGEFGNIYKGELKINENGKAREVAVKLPRDSLNLLQFRSLADELKIMSHIRPHVNVLHLVGACTQDIENRQLFVLTEFCENGSLKAYLDKNFMKFEGFEVNSEGQFLGAPGSVETLLKYAYQAANGMAYLAAEKIIHRDLALRNLLLSRNHIVKISDFGMSRRHLSDAVYKKKLSDDVPIPVFWMALESLAYSHYTKTSDVWSFGIVLWELFSCGKRPYRNHAPDAAFRKWLMESEENRMGPPNIACDEIYQLMLRCWKSVPEARPSFSECKRSISRILEQRSSSMYQSMLVNLSEAWFSVPTIVRRGSSGSRTSVGGQSVHVGDSKEAEVTSKKDKNVPDEEESPTRKKVDCVAVEPLVSENKLYNFINPDDGRNGMLLCTKPNEPEVGYNVCQDFGSFH